MDWLEIFLDEYVMTGEPQEDGSYKTRQWPHGDGEAQRLMARLSSDVEDVYARLISEEDFERLETTGWVPLIKDGKRGHWPLESLMLKDLPEVLDTFVVLEAEREQERREESERKAAERRERERVRAKERRKLKKLGEW
jgi:hypothetical protein